MILMGYEFLDHPADVWVRVWGTTLEEAFEQAARSLAKTMWGDSHFDASERKEIGAIGRDQPELLVNFLSEILFHFDVDNFAFNHLTIQKLYQSQEDWHILAYADGESFSREKHQPGTEVKAITYSYLKIEQREGRFVIEVIFDI
ncbi:MAG: archease family protein [Promethearchaeota archaeon CR_4]|nr:MAG: archease family protein [Candidatus Lokiarchaeota archaeon CR_4]